MTKFPLFIKTAQNIKRPQIPPIMPLVPYEEAVGYERIKGGYKQALRGRRKYTREAVKYDLFREKNNVDLWRELKSSKYTPGPYHFNVITEPKRRDLSIPQLRDKVVQLVIHEELQNMFRPVFINGSFACQYGRGPIRAAFKVQHDMRVARMKWGDNAAIIKIDARKFFYSIDRALLKKILAKRFKKLKKKRPETYEDLLRFYRLFDRQLAGGRDGHPSRECQLPGLREHLPQRARSVLCPLSRREALHPVHGRHRHRCAGQGDRPGMAGENQGIPPREATP